ncbi:MAG: MFS transporter [Candidatus Promineifilaceae bacterium]|nr:MFS transporter [Candidatus Promineifilaceae bacterium]
MTHSSAPEHSSEESQSSRSQLRELLGIRDFRLLWLGEGISLLGDQFGFIALPWLVLQLTGDALAIGLVLAIAGIPRALFMIFGGALTDRFSPRNVMLVTNVARMFLVSLLAAAVLASFIEMWMVYLFALLFGLADAFFYPAASAIVPTVVPRDQLELGNSITQGTAQVSLFLGPMLAGLLIALFGESSTAETSIAGLRGIGFAFAFDALTFLASATALSLMHNRKGKAAADEPAQGVWSDILEGLRYVWNDITLRTIFLVIAALTMLGNAPIIIGVPVLADERLPNGAAAFGILMSAYGAGSLIGIILSGLLPHPPQKWFGTILFLAVTLMGLFMAALVFVYSLWVGIILLLITGLIDGWVIIQFTTWLQRRSPERLLGRVMSLLMFSFVGLAPVADIAIGGLIEWNLNAVLLICGSLLALIAFFVAFQPAVRAMGVQTKAN